MRDRREALKLLAGGTAAAIGTSIITTSTAFADQGTASCAPSGWPASVPTTLPSNLATSRVGSGANRYTRIAIVGTLNPFNHSCPGDYATTRRYIWSISGGSVLREDESIQPLVPTVWDSDPTAVRAFDSSSASGHSNGTYTVTVQYQVICTLGTRTCWRCATIGVTFDVNGSNATVTGRSFSLSANDCPT